MIEPLTQPLRRLPQRRPHEHAPAEAQRDDQRPQHSTRAVVINDVAHLAEVDLGFLRRRWIFEQDDWLFLAPAELVHHEPSQRRITGLNSLTLEERMDLVQSQRRADSARSEYGVKRKRRPLRAGTGVLLRLWQEYSGHRVSGHCQCAEEHWINLRLTRSQNRARNQGLNRSQNRRQRPR